MTGKAPISAKAGRPAYLESIPKRYRDETAQLLDLARSKGATEQQVAALCDMIRRGLESPALGNMMRPLENMNRLLSSKNFSFSDLPTLSRIAQKSPNFFRTLIYYNLIIRNQHFSKNVRSAVDEIAKKCDGEILHHAVNLLSFYLANDPSQKMISDPSFGSKFADLVILFCHSARDPEQGHDVLYYSLGVGPNPNALLRDIQFRENLSKYLATVKSKEYGEIAITLVQGMLMNPSFKPMDLDQSTFESISFLASFAYEQDVPHTEDAKRMRRVLGYISGYSAEVKLPEIGAMQPTKGGPTAQTCGYLLAKPSVTPASLPFIPRFISEHKEYPHLALTCLFSYLSNPKLGKIKFNQRAYAQFNRIFRRFLADLGENRLQALPILAGILQDVPPAHFSKISALLRRSKNSYILLAILHPLLKKNKPAEVFSKANVANILALSEALGKYSDRSKTVPKAFIGDFSATLLAFENLSGPDLSLLPLITKLVEIADPVIAANMVGSFTDNKNFTMQDILHPSVSNLLVRIISAGPYPTGSYTALGRLFSSEKVTPEMVKEGGILHLAVSVFDGDIYVITNLANILTSENLSPEIFSIAERILKGKKSQFAAIAILSASVQNANLAAAFSDPAFEKKFMGMLALAEKASETDSSIWISLFALMRLAPLRRADFKPEHIDLIRVALESPASARLAFVWLTKSISEKAKTDRKTFKRIVRIIDRVYEKKGKSRGCISSLESIITSKWAWQPAFTGALEEIARSSSGDALAYSLECADALLLAGTKITLPEHRRQFTFDRKMARYIVSVVRSVVRSKVKGRGTRKRVALLMGLFDREGFLPGMLQPKKGIIPRLLSIPGMSPENAFLIVGNLMQNPNFRRKLTDPKFVRRLVSFLRWAAKRQGSKTAFGTFADIALLRNFTPAMIGKKGTATYAVSLSSKKTANILGGLYGLLLNENWDKASKKQMRRALYDIAHTSAVIRKLSGNPDYVLEAYGEFIRTAKLTYLGGFSYILPHIAKAAKKDRDIMLGSFFSLIMHRSGLTMRAAPMQVAGIIGAQIPVLGVFFYRPTTDAILDQYAVSFVNAIRRMRSRGFSLASIRTSLSRMGDQALLLLLQRPDLFEKGRRFAKKHAKGASLSPELCINYGYAVEVLGEKRAAALKRHYGIDYFIRYSPEMLRDLYSYIVNPEKNKGRDLVVVVYNKDDHNGAFYVAGRELDKLRRSKRVLVFETDNEQGFYDSLNQAYGTAGPVSTLIIGGHGQPDSIRLGAPKGSYVSYVVEIKPGVAALASSLEEQSYLDLTDVDELAQLRKVLARNATIILDSCSTGAGKESIAALISTVLAKIPGSRVLAPSIPTGISNYYVSKDGRIFVTYRNDKTHIFRGGKLALLVPKRKND